jgi:hypothetical protein
MIKLLLRFGNLPIAMITEPVYNLFVSLWLNIVLDFTKAVN